MTIHNELKYSPELLRGYQRALGHDDEGVMRISETLMPIIDIWRRPEWAHVIGERIFMASGVSVAVAAEISFVGIRNVAGSELLLTVFPIVTFETTALARARVGPTSATDVDGTVAVFLRDTRQLSILGTGQVGTGEVILITGAGAAVVGTHEPWNEPCIANERRELPALVLAPDTEFRVYLNTVNTQARASFWGWIRRAKPGELNLT